jgi:hypothetical protein
MTKESTNLGRSAAETGLKDEATQSAIDTAVLMEPYFQRRLGETPLNNCAGAQR